MFCTVVLDTTGNKGSLNRETGGMDHFDATMTLNIESDDCNLEIV